MKTTPYVPRRFLPTEIDLTQTEKLSPVYDLLEEGLDKLGSVEQLEAWLVDYGEVQSALGEARSRAYISMTCQTDDPLREQLYLHYVEVIDPWIKPRDFRLATKLVTSRYFEDLGQIEYYKVFHRSMLTQVKLYREENVARETELAKLSQAYQKIVGGMTVVFDGEEKTLTQVGKVLQETDRARRQAAWEAINKRRAQDADKLEALFDQMIAIRHQIALAVGFDDFRAYTFANYERFDYTPEDCLEFHSTIERLMVPQCRKWQEERRVKMGLDVLRPWDSSFATGAEVDPDNLPPLQPFKTGIELSEKSHAVFNKLDPRLGNYFSILRYQNLMDLDNRKGKAPGGYQSTLSEARLPFIFMNAVGAHRDVETMVHEAGHAFHALACRDQLLSSYRHAPIEFCEVASMGMELLASPYLTEFYSEADAKRAQRDHLIQIIKFFPWMAIVDAFQHWIYTHPGHTQAERKAHWLSLMERFGGVEDWSGYEEFRGSFWHRQLHIFEIPFYYVEYGIAQLGALQVWQASLKNATQALENYLAGLSLGGSKPLPELFSAAGLKFDFKAETIAPLVEAVQQALASGKH